MSIPAPIRTPLLRAMPGVYGRLRNAAWVAKWWYAQRRTGDAGPAADPFDSKFWEAQEAGDWDSFARLLVARFRPRSVLDVGCGSGSLLNALARVQPDIRILGLEHSETAMLRARSRGVTVQRFDATRLTSEEGRRLARALGNWDLVVSLEVAEHLPPWHARRFVRFLAHWDTVAFSAAQPGQGGVWHLNEQPAAYWIERFGREGLRPAAAGDALRRELEPVAIGPWYARNLIVFARAASPATVAAG